MNGRSIALVLAVFAPMLVACGGKATGGSSVGSGTGSTPTPIPGDYETPPPTTETPPPTEQPPPPVFQGGTGGSSQACVELCNMAATRSCGGVTPTPEEVAACPAECTVAFTEFAPCEDEFAAALSCILRSPQFNDLFDRICAGEEISDLEAEELAAVCQSQALAFSQCVGDTPPDPGGTCTTADQCVGCDDACEECECALGAGSASCESICGGGGACDFDTGDCSACETTCELCECSAGPGSTACDSSCGRGGGACDFELGDCSGCTTTCDSCNCTLGPTDETCIQLCAQEV